MQTKLPTKSELIASINSGEFLRNVKVIPPLSDRIKARNQMFSDRLVDRKAIELTLPKREPIKNVEVDYGYGRGSGIEGGHHGD